MNKKWMRSISAGLMSLLVAASVSFNAMAEETVTMDHAISFTGMALNDPIDGIWQGVRENSETKSVESFNEGISGDGKSLKLNGYQSGGNMEYVYTDLNEFHNKIIKFKMVFDGSFPNIDASFIAFALRVPEYSTKFFWDTNCYSFIIKGGSIEVQKHPAKYQGQDNNLGGTKGKTPVVVALDTPFTAGTYDVEVGVIDGKSPNTGEDSVNLIFRLNGKELVNIWDDSGRTPCVTQKGYFAICPIYTQEDVQDEEGKKESRSSITILPVDAGAGEETEPPANTTKQPENTTKRPENTTKQPVNTQTNEQTDSHQTSGEATETQPAQETGEPSDTTGQTLDNPADEPGTTTAAAEPIGGDVSGGGLSGGAIAGIVIGVIVVLGAGGFALYYFVIRKKTSPKE